VLKGSKAKKITSNKLDKLSTYGLLSEHKREGILLIIDSLIEDGCLMLTPGNRPVVSITETGREVMKGKPGKPGRLTSISRR
jgi:ATP-dependent DNA helicase RecQ